MGYILEINPLSVVSFAIVLPHSEGCLFTLLIVSFAVQKLLSLIRSHLFTFVFISITLEGGSQRILLWFMSSSVLPMFSSKSFIRSGQISRSVVSDSLQPHGLYVAHQPPLSMKIFRQEHWSGLPFPTPVDLPDPGIKPATLASPALAGRYFFISAT